MTSIPYAEKGFDLKPDGLYREKKLVASAPQKKFHRGCQHRDGGGDLRGVPPAIYRA
jgi:hypothetical protein